MSIDIVNLIESNPTTQMTADYQSKLIETFKQRFSSYEQQMFVASFYCYLNCQDNYVINLDDFWKWLGFSTKQHAKTLLERQFVVDKDYLLMKQTATVQGGHNKETFMLNVNTFKKFCLKASTKKADEIHDYYIKLEKILQEIIQQESNELKHQLEQAKEEIQVEHARVIFTLFMMIVMKIYEPR